MNEYLPVTATVAPVLRPGEDFWVVQLFDQQGYHSSCLHRTQKDVEECVMLRTEKIRALVFCSLPFQGTWSSFAMPNVTLPLEFKKVIGQFDNGINE